MSLVKGTNVAAPVVPFDTADVYPTHDSFYGIGGYREVTNEAARDAIPTERRRQGMVVFCQGTGVVYKLEADLTTWTPFRRYDCGVFWPGKPGNSQLMLRLKFPISCVFPASLTGSQFGVGVNPTANTTFTLRKVHGGTTTNIGDITFDTSGVPTITFASSVTFAVGDYLTITSQSPADNTCADISFTFAGQI